MGPATAPRSADGVSSEEWWLGVKLSRFPVLRDLPLGDASSRPFRFAPVDSVQQILHQIDQRAAGRIAFPDVLTNPETRDRYIFSALIEEAITSSQMEGASTTRQVAADMLRMGRPPADASERMILNNFEAMLHSNYWLFEYVSISPILKNAFAQYGKSYLYSESDENDATYFLIYQLEVMLRAIGNLDQYLQRKIAQTREVEARLISAATMWLTPLHVLTSWCSAGRSSLSREGWAPRR